MYPKMLYSAPAKFADSQALKEALAARSVKTRVVESAMEEKAAMKAGFTSDLASLIETPPDGGGE